MKRKHEFSDYTRESGFPILWRLRRDWPIMVIGVIIIAVLMIFK